MKSRHLFLRRWFDRKTPANAGVFALKEGMRMVYVILFVSIPHRTSLNLKDSTEPKSSTRVGVSIPHRTSLNLTMI